MTGPVLKWLLDAAKDLNIKSVSGHTAMSKFAQRSISMSDFDDLDSFFDIGDDAPQLDTMELPNEFVEQIEFLQFQLRSEREKHEVEIERLQERNEYLELENSATVQLAYENWQFRLEIEALTAMIERERSQPNRTLRAVGAWLPD